MFNPLAILNRELLEALVAAGHRWFVRQSFERGKAAEPGLKACLLLCHYQDYFRAKEYMDVLKQDAHRFLYDWQDAAHRQRLMTAATQPAGYRIYANVFQQNWQDQLTDRHRQQIRAYLKKMGWKPAPGESIEPQFYPHFGEVYVSLKYRSRELRVKFDQIENTL